MTEQGTRISLLRQRRRHTVEAREHALFAHNFEHVIQTWTNRTSTHGDARRMNKIAGFASKFLRERLQSRLKRLRIPLVDPGKLIAQGSQMRGRFRFSKNFIYRLWIEFVILGEKVRRPFGH